MKIAFQKEFKLSKRDGTLFLIYAHQVYQTTVVYCSWCVSLVSDNDFQMCKHLVEALEPVKLTTLGICQNDANLISADAALVFLLDELEKMANNQFAQNLYTAVIERVRERCNEEIIWLMKYLVNPENIQKEECYDGKAFAPASKIVGTGFQNV